MPGGKHKGHTNRKAHGLRGGMQGYPGLPHTVVRSPEKVMPDEMDVVLGYPLGGQLAAAATTIAKVWTPNAAWDVDPVLGSTSTPGFAEWATLYTYYRVFKYKIELEMCNLDTTPTSVYFVHTNENPGTVGTSYLDYAAQAYCSHNMVGNSTGFNKLRYRKTINCAKLLGSAALETADSLRSLTNAVPSDLLFFGIGLRSPASTNLTNGCVYSGYIFMTIRFYGRQNILTSLNSVTFEFDAKRKEAKTKKFLEGLDPDQRLSFPEKNSL